MAWWAARARLDPRVGTGVRPGARVMMTVWLTFGSVYSARSAAAAPQKAEALAQELCAAGLPAAIVGEIRDAQPTEITVKY